MKRAPYVGDAGVLGGGGQPAIPLQPETVAYLSRFSGAVSQTYKSALNQAIYRWKAAGVYSLLQDLWLLCADTQADSLRNLISASRDATVTGAPTFTARSGFSGLGASDYVSLPFSTSSVGTSSGFAWAGEVATGTASDTVLMGSGINFLGAVVFVGGPMLNRGGSSNPCISVDTTITNQGCVIGAVGTRNVSPASPGLSNSSVSAVTASPVAANIAAMPSIKAYGVFPTITKPQMRLFLSILQSCLEDIGSLP